MTSGLQRAERRTPPESTTLVTAADLVKRYDGRLVVDRVGLRLSAGETVVVVGPSGSGKTTLLRLLSGLERRDAGELELLGREVKRTPLSSTDIGFVFQNYLLFPHLTVAGNLAYPLRRQRMPRGEVRRRVHEALERVGLQGRSQSYPGVLSGGERQRVALMRAVIHRPRLLFLDEPFSALDVGLAQEMQDDVFEVARERAAGTVLVTHDPQFALAVADHLLVMRAGRLVQEGPPREMWDAPSSPFVAAFFGKVTTFDVEILGPGETGQPAAVELHGRRLMARPIRPVRPGRGRLVVRTGAVRLGQQPAAFTGRVHRVSFHGGETTVRLTLDGGDEGGLTAHVDGRRPLAVGATVPVSWDWHDGLLYPGDA